MAGIFPILRGINYDPGELDLYDYDMYERWFKFLGSMKINAVVFNSDMTDMDGSFSDPPENEDPHPFPVSSGKVSNADAFKWAFDLCRENFIEPIPYFGPANESGRLLNHYPDDVEGLYVGGGTGVHPKLPQPPEEFHREDGSWYVVGNPVVNPEGRPFVVKKTVPGWTTPDFFKVEGYNVNTEKWDVLVGRDINTTIVPPSYQYEYEYVNLDFNLDGQVYYLEGDDPGFYGSPAYGEAMYNLQVRRVGSDYEDFRVYYTYVHNYERRHYGYCFVDEDVRDHIEDTVEDIFENLAPVDYFHMSHTEIQQMHTCPLCYNTLGTFVGGKEVTPCGVLYGGLIHFYYDTIMDKAAQYQPGVVPKVLIFDDHFLWTHFSLWYGDESAWDESSDEMPYRYGYNYENSYNVVGTDSCRWLLTDCPNLVVNPWEFKTNMKDEYTDDYELKWFIEDHAHEALTGVVLRGTEDDLDGVPRGEADDEPPAPYGTPEEPYPAFDTIGHCSGRPEIMVTCNAQDNKQHNWRAGVWVRLNLFDDAGPIHRCWPIWQGGGATDDHDSKLHTSQSIEGSYYEPVPGRYDEWEIPEGWTEQEKWYTMSQDLGYMVPNSGWRPCFRDGYGPQDIDYARIGIYFDSLQSDWPDDPPDYKPGAGGKIWCDDAVFEESFRGGPWGESVNFVNYYFDTLGSGDDAFAEWSVAATSDLDPAPITPMGTDEYVETNVQRTVENPDIYSCRFECYGPHVYTPGNPNDPDGNPNYHVILQQEVPDLYENYGNYGPPAGDPWYNTEWRIGVHLRTKYVDTYRLANTWQWYHVIDRWPGGVEPEQKYLGMLTYDSSDWVLPGPLWGYKYVYDPPGDGPVMKTVKVKSDKSKGTQLGGGIWRRHAADVMAAEWSWSENKVRRWDNPASLYNEGIYDTPRLEYLWYRPYFMHELEKTWFEKK
jgi:hypothetical protein